MFGLYVSLFSVESFRSPWAHCWSPRVSQLYFLSPVIKRTQWKTPEKTHQSLPATCPGPPGYMAALEVFILAGYCNYGKFHAPGSFPLAATSKIIRFWVPRCYHICLWSPVVPLPAAMECFGHLMQAFMEDCCCPTNLECSSR